jgi:ribosomal protein S18 acetylase RimI-like enzyme
VTEVRVAGIDDAPEVGRILAAGFGDDPVLTWVFREPARADKLAVLFGFLAREALVPLGATYVLDRCCAAWTPPGTPDWPPGRGERFAAELAPVCADADLERMGVLDRAMQAAHPSEPLWYLGVIATEPAARGRGLGAEVLRDSLQVVDEAHLPAYLESTNPRNVSLYERHGFVETGRIHLPDGPSLTTMWREPR